MPNRNGLYLLSGRAARQPERKIDVPLEFRRDRSASPDGTQLPAAEEALIAELLITELRKRVRVFLADLANEDLGTALLDLCELRRILAEISPEQRADLNV
jgi:hypothetical protein